MLVEFDLRKSFFGEPSAGRFGLRGQRHGDRDFRVQLGVPGHHDFAGNAERGQWVRADVEEVGDVHLGLVRDTRLRHYDLPEETSHIDVGKGVADNHSFGAVWHFDFLLDCLYLAESVVKTDCLKFGQIHHRTFDVATWLFTNAHFRLKLADKSLKIGSAAAKDFEAVMGATFLLQNAIALLAVNSFVFACLVVLLEVLPQYFCAAAKVLTDDFNELAVLSVILDLCVGACRSTAGRCVHALKAESLKLRQQEGMAIRNIEGFRSAGRAQNPAALDSDSIHILVITGLAKVLLAVGTLNWMEQEVGANFAFEELVGTASIGLN